MQKIVNILSGFGYFNLFLRRLKKKLVIGQFFSLIGIARIKNIDDFAVIFSAANVFAQVAFVFKSKSKRRVTGKWRAKTKRVLHSKYCKN